MQSSNRLRLGNGIKREDETLWREIVKQMKDINVLDDKGKSILHYAIENLNTGLINYLVRQGANREVKNSQGITALEIAQKINLQEYASEYGYEDEVAILFKAPEPKSQPTPVSTPAERPKSIVFTQIDNKNRDQENTQNAIADAEKPDIKENIAPKKGPS